jgi:hypothetical protein
VQRKGGRMAVVSVPSSSAPEAFKPQPERDHVVLHNGTAVTLHAFDHAAPVHNGAGKLIGWKMMFRCTKTQRVRQYGYETARGTIMRPGQAA